MSAQHPTQHAPVEWNGDGTINRSSLAAYLGISRPTLYLAIKEGRVLIEGHWATYVPAKRGRPTRGEKRG